MARELFREAAQDRDRRARAHAIGGVGAGAIAQDQLLAIACRQIGADALLDRGDPARRVGKGCKDVIRVPVQRFEDGEERLGAVGQEEGFGGSGRCSGLREGELRRRGAGVVQLPSDGLPGGGCGAAFESPAQAGRQGFHLPVEDQLAAHDELALHPAQPEVPEPPRHEQRVLVDEIRVTRGVDDERAEQLARRDRSAGEEARVEAILGAELLEQRQGRRDLRDRGRVDRAGSGFGDENRPVLAFDLHPLTRADQPLCLAREIDRVDGRGEEQDRARHHGHFPKTIPHHAPPIGYASAKAGSMPRTRVPGQTRPRVGRPTDRQGRDPGLSWLVLAPRYPRSRIRPQPWPSGSRPPKEAAPR